MPRPRRWRDRPSRPLCLVDLHSAAYYRDRARRARRLALSVQQSDLRKTLRHAAQDFDEIANDLDTGTVEVHRPEALPQAT